MEVVYLNATIRKRGVIHAEITLPNNRILSIP